MTGKVLQLQNILEPDMKATRITERYVEWETLRRTWKVEKEEIRRYIYATDTTSTTNAGLPWKNKTTIPKICQIRDNLLANYKATVYPKRKSVTWEAADKQSVMKADAIRNFSTWWMDQPMFKNEMDKIMMDFVDYGNCFGTIEWLDQRVQLPDGKTQAGYVGPMVRRINPLNMLMNPTAENFTQSPKIIRSIMSLGEVREMLERMSKDENNDEYMELYEYLRKIRFHARTFQGENWDVFDRLYAVDGFTSFRAYLLQDFVEVLTFYGDWYDDYNDNFGKNRVITVVDRHKLIGDKANPSFFGNAPIFHCAWRAKQDNLWGMGPLDNLIGMQYRIDHIENMKADIFDLVTYPVQKIKGFVEDYVWQPGEKIFIPDDGSDVELVVPEVNVLQANIEIEKISNLMEEMAGAPKEAMGFRSPGEKTAFEVQRLENAASRIFQSRITQFEEQMMEPLLNAMLELTRRNMVGSTTIKITDDNGVQLFQSLTVEDITGVGRIRPVAARNFAEKAQLVQNLTNLASSPLWQTIQPHFSGIKLAGTMVDALDVKDQELFSPFIAMTEQAEGQMQMQALQEHMQNQIGTATGMDHDFDLNKEPQAKPQGDFGLKRQPPASAEPGGLLATQ